MPLNKFQKGSALISALLIISIVTLLAGGMIFRQQVEIRRTQSIFQTERFLGQAAWVELWAIEKLKETFSHFSAENEYIAWDQSWVEPLENFEQEGLSISANIIDLQGFFNINNISIFIPEDEAENTENAEENAEQTEQTTQAVQVENEEGVLPSTPSEFLTEDNLYSSAWVFARLLENTGQMNKAEALALTEAILYWILARPIGVNDQQENNYYLELPDPYEPAHQAFNSVSELFYIQGMEPPIYAHLQPYLAVIPPSKESNNGSITKINVNTTSREIISAVLNLDVGRAEALLSSRPYTTMEFLNEQVSRLKTGKDKVGETMKLLDVTSQFFLLRAVIGDGKRNLVQYSIIKNENGKFKIMRRLQGEL